MQITSCDFLRARCDDRGSEAEVDLSLVGPQAPGTWVLVFLGAAREVLAPHTARQVLDALTAVESVMTGSSDVEHLFADLIDREPPLPEHLRKTTTGD